MTGKNINYNSQITKKIQNQPSDSFNSLSYHIFQLCMILFPVQLYKYELYYPVIGSETYLSPKLGGLDLGFSITVFWWILKRRAFVFCSTLSTSAKLDTESDTGWFV